MTRPFKTVGVLGGMGPGATAEYFRRLVARTPATRDQDHLHVLIDCDPQVPGRSEAILRGGPDPSDALRVMACRLAAAGAELLAIPCNAAHYYLPVIRAAAGVPVLDMLAETVERLPGVRTGLLATTATIYIGLYQRACAARGIEVLVPDGNDQRIVMAMVDAIKAGDAPEAQREHLDRVAARLARRGAESIVIGCTEISLIGGERQEQTRIDALDCLVDATLREATG